MLQRETGQAVNIDDFLRRMDVNELREMLAKEAKNQSGKHIREEKTGFGKAKKNGNPNKIFDFNDADQQERLN